MPAPAEGYQAALVTALGAVARAALSGRLLLAASLGARGGCLRFSSGSLSGMEPPLDGSPGASADPATVRQAILRAVASAAPGGSEPRFEPAPLGSVAGAQGRIDLNAADLALDVSRLIEDLAWLRNRLLATADGSGGPLRAAVTPPRCRPSRSIGPNEGFLLSRADGSLTMRQLLQTAPFSEIETLRAIYALRAIGMIEAAGDLAPVNRTAPAAPEDTLSRLDRFLGRTSLQDPAGGRATAGACERDELLQRCRAIEGQDHYSVLEVEHSATEPQIRQAYYSLARRYHPDRLRKPHLEDIHRQLEGMFAAVTEAYNTLSNSTARAEYDREQLERGAGRRRDHGVDRIASGREAFQRGRREQDAGRVFEAIRMFEAAIEHDPAKAEYHHCLGVCQGQNPRWRKKAEESLLKAIELNPGGAESYVELARVYRKGGLERRALEMYEHALRWDPTCQEALQATAPRKDSHSGTGIFKAIFKKD